MRCSSREIWAMLFEGLGPSVQVVHQARDIGAFDLSTVPFEALPSEPPHARGIRRMDGDDIRALFQRDREHRLRLRALTHGDSLHVHAPMMARALTRGPLAIPSSERANC